MNIQNMLRIFLVVGLSVTVAACGDDDTTPPPGTDAGGRDSGGGDVDAGDTDAGDPGGFDFRTDDAAMYTRVDRMGMPAVSTALITMKDQYNDGDPAGDITPPTVPFMWGGEIIGNLSGLHEVLEGDLTGLSLTGCADYTVEPADASNCVLQEVAAGVSVASLVIPDTISIDTAAAAGFPNGRTLTDPAMDRTLSIILLDVDTRMMATPPHGPGTLEGVPLNPTANDMTFGTAFPYLAAPHTP